MNNLATAIKEMKNEAITLTDAFQSTFLPKNEPGVRCVSTFLKDENAEKGKVIQNLFYKAENIYNMSINPTLDYYLTLNSLKSWNRTSSNVLVINSFYVDIDYRKKNLTKDQCLSFLYQVLEDENIFEPTLIMDSGRGMWLLWNIEPIIVNSPKIVNLWNQIESDLIAKLSVLGADTSVQSVTNLVRLPGSINQKNHVKTALISYKENAIYEMRDFQNEISTFQPKTKERNTKISIMKNEYHLNYLRVIDIEKLFELRQYDVLGLRNVMLFIYRNMLNMAEVDNAAVKIEEMNQKLTQPLSTSELKSLNKENKQYLFKNTTLIERLDITADEMPYLKTIIDREEYKRRQRNARNKRYKATKEANKAKKDKRAIEIKALFQKGFKQAEIARKIGVHRNTVRNVLKK